MEMVTVYSSLCRYAFRPLLILRLLACLLDSLIDGVFLNVRMFNNKCNPPLAELRVEAGGALAVALLAISLVCLNIFLIITVQLLESVRACCLKAEPQLI